MEGTRLRNAHGLLNDTCTYVTGRVYVPRLSVGPKVGKVCDCDEVPSLAQFGRASPPQAVRYAPAFSRPTTVKVNATATIEKPAGPAVAASSGGAGTRVMIIGE